MISSAKHEGPQQMMASDRGRPVPAMDNTNNSNNPAERFWWEDIILTDTIAHSAGRNISGDMTGAERPTPRDSGVANPGPLEDLISGTAGPLEDLITPRDQRSHRPLPYLTNTPVTPNTTPPGPPQGMPHGMPPVPWGANWVPPWGMPWAGYAYPPPMWQVPGAPGATSAPQQDTAPALPISAPWNRPTVSSTLPKYPELLVSLEDRSRIETFLDEHETYANACRAIGQSAPHISHFVQGTLYTFLVQRGPDVLATIKSLIAPKTFDSSWSRLKAIQFNHNANTETLSLRVASYTAKVAQVLDITPMDARPTEKAVRQLVMRKLPSKVKERIQDKFGPGSLAELLKIAPDAADEIARATLVAAHREGRAEREDLQRGNRRNGRDHGQNSGQSSGRTVG
ncbi:hypothetical protein J8273_0904 [Carpediemonas membranifera]|uniref:Uncharacterized protein n=1 Tax=Carpediemonas membranifera TaxID=201153 RepID=A0A8J6BAB0_9EUKA|nr:hypothetical protein J8273_0904 [Carpediemonas membranifera]|eukprot:KAG9397414.1 hypothetical protein J8273_0904 [Carpediemonas membranifera]